MGLFFWHAFLWVVFVAAVGFICFQLGRRDWGQNDVRPLVHAAEAKERSDG